MRIIVCFLSSLSLLASNIGAQSLKEYQQQQNKEFKKFKTDLEQEYKDWLKHETEWDKITLEEDDEGEREPEVKPEEKVKAKPEDDSEHKPLKTDKSPGKEPEKAKKPDVTGKRVPVPEPKVKEKPVEQSKFKTDKKPEDETSARSAGPRLIPSIKPITRKPCRMSSKFGYRNHPIHKKRTMHKGIDFASPKGTPILATADGKVLRAGVAGGYGNFILLRHAKGYKTAYAHMNELKVKNNQKVKRGDEIGTVGSSGRSTGTHLHYEVIKGKKKVNPAKFMP